MDSTSITEVAVLFADLAGFTALTEAHGDEQAADAAVRLLELGFCSEPCARLFDEHPDKYM